jgi:hypothetical protein
MPKQTYLKSEHIRYIIVRYHIEGIKPGQLLTELTDPEALEKYNIHPVPGLTLNYLYRKIPRIKASTVETVKTTWLNGLLDESLANKRVRIRELTSLYKNEGNSEIKRKILKDIKDEVGEDAWREAMKSSGVKIALSNIPEEQVQQINNLVKGLDDEEKDV